MVHTGKMLFLARCVSGALLSEKLLFHVLCNGIGQFLKTASRWQWQNCHTYNGSKYA